MNPNISSYIIRKS